MFGNLSGTVRQSLERNLPKMMILHQFCQIMPNNPHVIFYFLSFFSFSQETDGCKMCKNDEKSLEMIN